ncbi:MAG: potassium channel family protein [Candidatus Woesearchaeota archaeon]
MYKTQREQKQELLQRLSIIILFVSVLLLLGSIVYHFSEGWSWKNSLYFSTISLVSRGYSNLYPHNWFSVLFSVIYLILGAGVLLYALSSLIAYYTSYYQQTIEKKVKTITENIKRKRENKNNPWIMIKSKKE